MTTFSEHYASAEAFLRAAYHSAAGGVFAEAIEYVRQAKEAVTELQAALEKAEAERACK